MRTYVFLPPLAAPTGGTAVLLRLAQALHAAGLPVAVVERQPGPVSAALDPAVARVAWDCLALTPADLWLVPEGWVNALAPGLAAGCRSLVYVQNWAYLFSALPAGVDWRSLPRVEFLAVSQPVAWHLEQTLGVRAQVLRPGIDTRLFAAPPAKPGALAVAYMPRKNKALVERVTEIFRARNPGAQVVWRAISGLGPAGVAQALGDSHVFLASGFPEGCPLPPLEAMACGCLPVGFGGLGGWDSMRQAADYPWLYTPWWPLRDVPWAGNGLWVADADVPAAALAVETALEWWRRADPRLAPALAAAQATAAAYSLERQAAEAVALWSRLAQGQPCSIPI